MVYFCERRPDKQLWNGVCTRYATRSLTHYIQHIEHLNNHSIKGRVQKRRSAKVWSLTISLSPSTPPNLNYGLLIQIFLWIFFTVSVGCTNSKWILVRKNPMKKTNLKPPEIFLLQFLCIILGETQCSSKRVLTPRRRDDHTHAYNIVR